VANGISWVRFYFSDFIADTIDLDNCQMGIYIRLLGHYYTRGGLPRKLKYISRVARVDEDDEDLEYILETYFVNEDGEWRHYRADHEMDRAKAIHRVAVESGKRGAKKRWNDSNANGNPYGSTANGVANSSANSKADSNVYGKNQNQNQNQRSNKVTPYTADFETVWKAWPEKQEKRRSFNAWKSKKSMLGFPSVEDILVMIEKLKKSRKWQDGFIPYLSTWLNGHRWEDEVESEESPEERIKRLRGGGDEF
jgi:uncharacterized protein YdaU (DUF1376 family)